jgi:hypothetical protein
LVRVTAASSPRLTLAALVATKPGQRQRLIHRAHPRPPTPARRS